MKHNQILVLFLLITTLINCKVSSKQIVGTYVDPQFGDTLEIRTDGSYEYLEKLNSGVSGWTNGKWEIKNRKIQFQCDHKPLVGYRLKVRRDSSVNNFQIKLQLGDTEEPIYIEGVKIFKNNLVLRVRIKR